jgi:PDZ domain-containing protein
MHKEINIAHCPVRQLRASSSRIAFLLLTLTLFCVLTRAEAEAENFVEVPLLAAIGANDRGVFEVMTMRWDQQATPDPMQLKGDRGNVNFRTDYMAALQAAFQYALRRTPGIRPTGTLRIGGLAYVPTSTDGPSAGAAMTVAFLAVLRGEAILRGVAITGTIQPNGKIGPVGKIADKVRAAVREHHRTVLIPQGQMYSSQWNLEKLGLELNVTVKEVSTIDEAYELMTGRKL